MLTRLERASEVVVGAGGRLLGLGYGGLLGVGSDCLSETYTKSVQFTLTESHQTYDHSDLCGPCQTC